jgi:nucleoid-associated protein YgaU
VRAVANALSSGASAATASESKAPSTGGESSQLAEYSLPVLQFAWGAGLAYSVTLESVTANYERFTASGIPVQASVNLTLKQHGEPPKSTNPSSGGLPGRAGHTVIAGDSLVSIANATYGSPQAWRALAQANGLDDPLRIGPGSQLFLPSPAELHQGDKP